MAPRLSDYARNMREEAKPRKVTIAKNTKPEIIERPSKDTWRLGMLAYFLDMDLDSVPRDERQKYLFDWHFGWDYSSERHMWNKAKKLQKELRGDVMPIVEKQSGVFVTNLGYEIPPLHALVYKINDMKLRFSWDISSVNPQTWGYRRIRDENTGQMTYDLEKYPHPILRRQNQPLLKLGDSKYYIVRFSPVDSPDAFFYGIIIEALEDGSFSRLGKCEHCHKLFFAKRAGDKYDRDCGKKVDALKAAKRMERLRNKREEESRAEGLPRLAKLANAGIQKIRQVFGEEMDEFLPFAEQIRSGQKAERIWQRLPPRFKKAIAEADV
jgi:hypothetical protein